MIFQPPTGADTLTRGGVSASISTRFICITEMESYKNSSLEELRAEYYAENVKSTTPGRKNPFGNSSVSGGNTFPNNGAKLLAENFGDAFKNPRFSDVILKAGDAEFPAHKIILSTRCKVFERMFDSKMKESEENVVNLAGMEPSTAEDMLRYIYTGKIREQPSIDRVTDLYIVADRYDLPELKQCCKDFILNHISPDSVCDVAVLASMHSDEDLDKAAKRIIRNDVQSVMKSEKWLSSSKKNPAFYLEILQEAMTDNSDFINKRSHFISEEKKEATSGSFSFGTPSQAEAVNSFQTDFNINTPPSFNFGATSTPAASFQFAASCEPASNQASAPRKYKKCVRRVFRKLD